MEDVGISRVWKHNFVLCFSLDHDLDFGWTHINSINGATHQFAFFSRLALRNSNCLQSSSSRDILHRDKPGARRWDDCDCERVVWQYSLVLFVVGSGTHHKVRQIRPWLVLRGLDITLALNCKFKQFVQMYFEVPGMRCHISQR